MKRTKKLQAGAVALLMICVTFSAFGGGPLNLNLNDPENFERWPNGGVNIPFNLDGLPTGGSGALALGPLTHAQATALSFDAFDVWQDIPSATATYQDNGLLPFDVDETNFVPFVLNLFLGTNTADGLSPVVYDQDGAIFVALFGFSGVLGFASPDTFDANGVPLEAVCFLNGGAILSGFPVADFFGVMVHEDGHYSGLAHTVVNGENVLFLDQSGPTPANTFGNSPLNQVETMYPFALIGGGAATVHLDDVGIYSQLYPAAGFATSTGSITGTVFDSDEITPLTGVNVIARNLATGQAFTTAASSISGDRGIAGVYTINGLPPGNYAVFIDEIIAGGFSTPPLAPLPGPEEFYNGANESNNVDSPDNPSDFVPVGVSAGSTASSVDIIINSFGPGQPLPVGDDGNVEVPMGFSFSLCGQSFNTVFINANGNLSFGSPSFDFTESAAEFLGGPPRVAGLWDDINPNAGGTVTFDRDKNNFTVFYTGVPEFPAAGSNTFQINLKRASNHVRFDYGGLSATDGLAGVSCGGFVTSGLETESDLTGHPGTINLSNLTASFELFTGDGDLANDSVRFNGTHPFTDKFEPNNSPAAASAISLPFNTADNKRDYSAISPIGNDVDFFRFSASANTTLIAETISGALDSVLGLFQLTPGGPVLIATDDDGGAGLLSRLVFPISVSGDYAIAVSTFPDFDFDGDGNSGGRYVLDLDTISGIVIPLGDDTTFELPLGFSFPFQGGSFSSVFVNSNGNFTFGSGDTDFTESVSEFLAEAPRIAPLWDDLSPNQGGIVTAEFNPGSVTITFSGVPQFLAGDSNNFSLTLNSSGDFTISYQQVDANDGLVGNTPGGGAPNPGETNLDAVVMIPMNFAANGTTYEIFSGGADSFDLENKMLPFLVIP